LFETLFLGCATTDLANQTVNVFLEQNVTIDGFWYTCDVRDSIVQAISGKKRSKFA